VRVSEKDHVWLIRGNFSADPPEPLSDASVSERPATGIRSCSHSSQQMA